MCISYPIICHGETRKKQSSGFIWLPPHVQHPYTKLQYAVISDTPSPCKGWVSHVFFSELICFLAMLRVALNIPSGHQTWLEDPAYFVP